MICASFKVKKLLRLEVHRAVLRQSFHSSGFPKVSLVRCMQWMNSENTLQDVLDCGGLDKLCRAAEHIEIAMDQNGFVAPSF